MTGADQQPVRLTYSVEEAAKLLGISRAFAYKCIKSGEIPHIRIGGRILVSKSALHLFVDGPRAAAEAPTQRDQGAAAVTRVDIEDHG